MESKPLWFSFLLSVLLLTHSLSQFDLLFWLVWFHNKRNKNVDAIVSMWCSESLYSLHLSGVNNTFKAPKCMTKVMSSLHVLSFFLSVSQTHMYKYRHSSLDPPLTHLRQLFLRAPENIISAKQTAASRSASSHDLCPFASFWSTLNLNRSTLHSTDVVSETNSYTSCLWKFPIVSF